MSFHNLRSFAVLVAGSICGSHIGYAQGTASRSPSQLDTPEAYQQLDAQQEKDSRDPTSPWYTNPISLLTWGPVKARPHLNTRFSYGDRLRSRTGAGRNTVIEEISPGSLFELGSKWTLDYTPTLSFYSSKEFEDTLDHSVALTGGTTYENWAFGLSQTYLASSQPLIETGRQTDQESFGTALSASYRFNNKLMLELGANQNFRSAKAFSSSRSWSSMNWLNYQISPWLSVAGGLGGGYDAVSPGFDMAFQQFQGRVNALVAKKLTLSINGGGEVREILVSGADPLINPIFGATIDYRPFEHTTLTLSGNRSVSSSLLQGQVNESTGVSVALNQRLLGLLYLTLSGGFRNNQYISSNAAQTLSREDDTTSLAARLSYRFIERATIAVFYNFHDNSSNTTGFDYSSRQVGLQLSYRF